MSANKTFIVKMSDGQHVRIAAIQQLGTPASPYFVNERQDTIAGFGVVLGWWTEDSEIKNEEQPPEESVNE